MWATGRSAAGETAESLSAKWERRSLSAPRSQVQPRRRYRPFSSRQGLKGSGHPQVSAPKVLV